MSDKVCVRICERCKLILFQVVLKESVWSHCEVNRETGELDISDAVDSTYDKCECPSCCGDVREIDITQEQFDEVVKRYEETEETAKSYGLTISEEDFHIFL